MLHILERVPSAGKFERTKLRLFLDFFLIGHFTVVCLVTWPRIGNEAGGDLVLIQTSLFLRCKYKLVSIRRE